MSRSENKNKMIKYLNLSEANAALEKLKLYSDLKIEYGSETEVEKIYGELLAAIGEYTNRIKAVENTCPKEPNDLETIKALRTAGPRKLWDKLPDNIYDKMAGAVLGRFAGCILGVPVEGMAVENMKKLAGSTDMSFPPTDYWNSVPRMEGVQYGTTPRSKYTKSFMDCVGVDDDITYTLLGLIILEKYGFNLTTEDVGKAWLELLPVACTAEHVALNNLKNGFSAYEAADIDNPYCQWIGADIRSDPWAFACAGYPEKAAELAYKDAYLSHRRNGIYGEMFFSAVQAAAFAVDTAEEAVRIGLSEIPSECMLYNDIVWALEKSPEVKNYLDARKAVDERFAGMHPVHTNNNACLVVFGLMLGGGDFTKVISEVVAMGLDNDCTGATAGSIMGALVGKKGISEHWYKNFNNKVQTYMNGYPEFSIDDVIDRFVKLAEKLYGKLSF